MRQLFKPWRRKAGLTAVTLALAMTVAWLASKPHGPGDKLGLVRFHHFRLETSEMKSRNTLLTILLISVALTAAGPSYFGRSVNVYSEDFQDRHIRRSWDCYGGWFQWYRSHPAWPEYGIPAEQQFMPLGFLLSVLLWSAVVGWFWLVARPLRSMDGNRSRVDAAEMTSK